MRGPTEQYFSKFKNDNWAMDGYVSSTKLLHIPMYISVLDTPCAFQSNPT